MVRAGKQVAKNETSPNSNCRGPAIARLGGATYGELQPAVSLLQRARSRLPVRFVTVVLTDERCKFELRRASRYMVTDEWDREHRVESVSGSSDVRSGYLSSA